MNRYGIVEFPTGPVDAVVAGDDVDPAIASSGAPTPESPRMRSQTAATAPAHDRTRERWAVGPRSPDRRRNLVTRGTGSRSTP